jgi:hypothetical protein
MGGLARHHFEQFTGKPVDQRLVVDIAHGGFLS